MINSLILYTTFLWFVTDTVINSNHLLSNILYAQTKQSGKNYSVCLTTSGAKPHPTVFPCLALIHVFLCLALIHVFLCLSLIHVFLCLSLIHVFLCLSLIHVFLCLSLIHVFLCLSLVACFPVLDTSCLYRIA